MGKVRCQFRSFTFSDDCLTRDLLFYQVIINKCYPKHALICSIILNLLRWIRDQQVSEGVTPGEDVYIILRLDGRVRRSGKVSSTIVDSL